MRIARAVAPVILLGSLAACGTEDDPGVAAPPRLGGPTTHASPPPADPMDPLESSVTERLNTRLADDGLRLQHVDCPAWHGAVPGHLRCDGYVDGVVGQVEVELVKGNGAAVEFDAELGDGIVATARLVDRLRQEGHTGVSCGAAAAYPARPGLRIVCRVHRDGAVAHVVATVSDRSGAVQIEDY